MKLTEKTKRKAREKREKRIREQYASLYEGSHIYFENPKNNPVQIVWRVVMEFCDEIIYEGTVLAKLKNEDDEKFYVLIGDDKFENAVIAVLSYDQTYHAFVKAKDYVLKEHNGRFVDELLSKANKSNRWKEKDCECVIEEDGSIKIIAI